MIKLSKAQEAQLKTLGLVNVTTPRQTKNSTTVYLDPTLQNVGLVVYLVTTCTN